MRVLAFVCLGAFLWSCNSSSKKDPNQAMDDTARMRYPPSGSTNIIIEPVKISAADIPSTLIVKGKLQEAWKWNDYFGENIFITSAVVPYDDKDEFKEEGQSAEIYAVHYAKKEGEYRVVWNLSDAIKTCPVDITLEFIPGSTTITDLDKDGIAETKVQYSSACRGDVSPATMRVILDEKGVRYTLKGNRWLRYSPEFKFTVTEQNVNLDSSPKLNDEEEEMLRTFGRYENEKDFVGAPPEFLKFARTEWLKFVMEKMGD